VEAFPDDTAPSSLLRDRDTIDGHAFRQRVKDMGIREVLTAPQSPWQSCSTCCVSSLSFCGGHRQLALENLALRQQLAVFKRTVTRPHLRTTDRLFFWVWLARVWAGWRPTTADPLRDHTSGGEARELRAPVWCR
jgi:hypothetical protein